MYKSSTEKTQGVKGTGLVKALGTGLLESWSPTAIRITAFLACHGGDAHAHNHHDWYVLVGLPRRTYYRVLGQLEADGVIEICTDERCPHAVWGALGWRFTLRFTRWLNRPDSPFPSATRGTESVPSVAHLELVDSRGTQGVSSTRRDTEEYKRTAHAAAPSGRGPEEDVMPTRGPEEDSPGERTIGADPEAKPKPPNGHGPVFRIRMAFREEAQRLGKHPWYASVAKMQSQIRWLLDHGYTEQTIIDSFAFLGNIVGSHPVNEANPLWDVYYRNKDVLLKQGADARVGGRDTGPVSTDNIAAMRKGVRRSSWT